MTFQTHRVFAIGWVVVGNVILHNAGVTHINYYLSLIVMLQFGKYGALFPDIDHNWQNVKEKTVPNYIINKLIHLTGGKHRSWQTHSIDIALLTTFLSYTLPIKLLQYGIISEVNKEVLTIALFGFSIGWLSHLFSDMLTSAGVRLFCINKKKIALVPKQFMGLRFNTGNEWENFVYQLTRRINIPIGLLAVIYPIIPFIPLNSII